MIEVELKDGLKVGEDRLKNATLREATVGDMIDATTESERAIATPDGYALVASPTLVGLNTLRRQIVNIGDVKGPISLAELRKLSAGDLLQLQESAAALDTAALREVERRGRDTAAKGDA